MYLHGRHVFACASTASVEVRGKHCDTGAIAVMGLFARCVGRIQMAEHGKEHETLSKVQHDTTVPTTTDLRTNQL